MKQVSANDLRELITDIETVCPRSSIVYQLAPEPVRRVRKLGRTIKVNMNFFFGER